MEDEKENIFFAFAVIGCIADSIGIIFSFINENTSVAFLGMAIVFLILLSAFLLRKYIERCNFLRFIKYLFYNEENKFNILPKICLELDNRKKWNNLVVKKLNIKYIYDMSNIKNLNNLKINYINIIEYNFICENNKIPNEFVCYYGNMHANNPLFKISQKHGIQNNYEAVPSPRYVDEKDEAYISSAIQKYRLHFKKENITKGKVFPFSFKLECKDKADRKAAGIIVFYPKQYAKTIEEVNFDILFKGKSKNILKKVQLFKICKEGNNFKTIPIYEFRPQNNEFSYKIEPDSSKYEVYYFQVYWEITDTELDCIKK